MTLSDLPAHADLLRALRREVEAGDGWRWLELSCSLAADRGDEFSDIDVGVGHRLADGELERCGGVLVGSIGSVVDLLIHAEDGWPEGVRRFAVEYEVGVQLDLVAMPAGHRPGLPEGSLALVDKDGLLREPWTPPVATATGAQAREWSMLGWWALSDVAKYVRRGSLQEAVEALGRARTEALRLHAVGRGVPCPSFGLTSLLDVEPADLPESLASAHALPEDPRRVIEAALVVARLLDTAVRAAGEVLDRDLTTPWADLALGRLDAAVARPAD